MEIKDFKDRTCISYLDQIDIDDGGPQGAQIELDKEAIKDLVNFLIGE
jgi:hypothetical protein